MKKKYQLFLPIILEEVILRDEKGNRITGIRGITTYKKGIVVLTDKAVYSNVKLKQ